MKKRRSRNGIIVIVFSVVCFLAVLSAMFLNNDGTVNTGATQEKSILSLQDYINSKEYQAYAEWLAFKMDYDKDGSILASMGEKPTGLDEKYDKYSVYTKEMADKLDEITNKYGLKLHNKLYGIPRDIDWEDFCTTVATGNFLGNNTPAYGYMYDDGVFMLEFLSQETAAQVGGISNDTFFDCQFACFKKGSFTEIMLGAGNANNYEEWSYRTSFGVTVNLAIGPQQSLIFFETETAYIIVHIHVSSTSITSAVLEEFADSFDFSLLK